MSTTMREVERKFAVDEGFALPPLSGATGVGSAADEGEATLTATYYDTTDLRLARSRVTLRRRTGGKDAGWHLKLPAGRPGDRDEVQLPLGRAGAVPEELADRVAAIVRAEPLAPVATLTTVRHTVRLLDPDGTPVAEVADDHVRAKTLGGATSGSSWREVEVELVPGADRDLLDSVGAVLREAGAEPSRSPSKLVQALGERALGAPDLPPGPELGKKPTAGDVLTAYLRAQVAALLAADPQVRRGEGDGVHDLRVAARRLRSVLHSFAGLLDDPQHRARGLQEELRWVAGMLGEARDHQVLLARLEAGVAALPAQVPSDGLAGWLGQQLTPGGREAGARAREALRSARYTELLDGLVALAASPDLAKAAAGPAADVLPPLVARDWRRLTARVAAAGTADAGPVRDAALHAARKAAKRTRYAAELVAPALPGAADLAGQVTAVQEVLGDHQDCVGSREVLRDLALGGPRRPRGAPPAPPEVAFPLGLLYAGEETAAAALRESFTDVWAEADRRRHRRWLG